MYLYDKNRITYFAQTDRRNKRVPFGIKAEDRTRHMYIIGKTGMGKSTLIENMAVQDIKNGEGFAFIDPHGKSADLLLEYIPPERVRDVVYFAPFDMDNPISFNIMEDIGPDKRHLVANGLMSVFKKIWVDVWSARMEYILANVLLALLEYPEATLLGVNRMLADKAYRKKVVDNLKDPGVKAFWEDEYAKYSERYTQEATPAIQNKIGQFTSNPLIRNIIGQPHSSFDLRKLMDERKILIVNLSKGRVGEGNANLLGAMLITKIYLSAMSRAELPEYELKKLPNFYLYVDEFQSFANESFANILSEARKYKLSLIMAHQYIEQMSEEVTAAVFGNVGTQVMFRVGATDAEHLEKEYAPVFTAEDMVNLGFTQIYLKLMIDGVASQPFSATTLSPIEPQKESKRDEVISASRETYSHPRVKVEEEIAKWYLEAKSTEKEKP
ncbi:MAG: type IV secretion system DNA-binding domain-containing protein, partial [Candidatus Pacebacteria bacterium]|nr:type IV secretion system DNA-binding domain-containing protein [Candidatus Paceibacterota bacterium]